MSDFLLQEDGVSKLVLQDASGDLIQEVGRVDPSFIASATAVYTPTLPEVHSPAIASATVLYTPTVAYTGAVPAVSAAGTFKWLCPAGVTSITVEAIGGGGGGANNGQNTDGGGGGGGAYAGRAEVPVTPGTLYTFVVGAGGAAASGASTSGADGGASSFTGDSSIQIIAAAGKGGSIAVPSQALGGQVADSTGDAGLVFAGGKGGATVGGAGEAGDGGGASGNRLAAGADGTSGTGGAPTTGGAGGAGANGGGSGGRGGGYTVANAQAGGSPGGGGGGGGGFETGAAGGAGQITITPGILQGFIHNTQVYAPRTNPQTVTAPFIASVTVAHAPSLTGIAVPFIPSHTSVFTPLVPEVHPPFIASHTRVYGAFSLFDPAWTGVGPGNGGETFPIHLNAHGATSTATLAASLTADDLLVELTGDGGFPTATPFVATIDSEIVYLMPRGAGAYSVRGRGMSNTTPAAHTAGVTVSWGDSYDQAIIAAADIAHSFTADINSTGLFTYYGFLICFDSSQAYLAGSRYPMHVAEVLGVFDAGAGSSGSNRCDSSQPNAVCTPVGVSDDCPAALSNPALITSNITIGDVAVIRYTNPEATALDLGPRSAALQSWFGLKRVDATDHDVTLTDPNGYVVDTIPSGGGPGPFTGSVNHEWADPLADVIGIAPDASDAAGTPIPTPNPVPWTTVTLPGSDRYFTYGPPHYSETGWPICCLAVRQGNRRIPRWQSWDWHDYSYVYAGFGTDDTFCQLLINRNGIVFDSVPSTDLPGSQNIDGPDAVWDDGTYYFAASWYVVIFGTPYVVFGPTVGGGVAGAGGFAPGVTFPGGGGGGPDVTVPPPTIEGGSGGDITPPPGGVLAWTKQGH